MNHTTLHTEVFFRMCTIHIKNIFYVILLFLVIVHGRLQQSCYAILLLSGNDQIWKVIGQTLRTYFTRGCIQHIVLAEFSHQGFGTAKIHHVGIQHL